MSVANPYSDSNVSAKPYFANQGFEPDPESGRPGGDVKKFPPAQLNGAADKDKDGDGARPPLVNPYGSIYRSAAGGPTPTPGPGGSSEEGAGRPCPCCRRGGCCPCCRLCLIS